MSDEDNIVDEGDDTDPQPDNTGGETPENEEKGDDNKVRRSEIAQKRHWREKAEKASSKVETLEAELAELRGAVKKPGDDAERKAQEYIRKQAREVYEELQKAKATEETKEQDAFNEKVATILEENPDFSEEELLDIIEEYEVEPQVALKILKKSTSKSTKPKMPKPGKANAEEEKDKPDDSKKSMWDILKEETATALKK